MQWQHQAADGESDGRRRRSADSRRRIVEAVIRLVRQGDAAPSADKVAAEAGVGRRTLFRLFSDMESIYREIQTVMLEKIAPVRAIPLKGDTQSERLHALIDRRSRFFEEILPLTLAAELHRPRSAMVQAGHARMQAELRAILIGLLPAPLLADPVGREAADAVLSMDLWRRLRVDQGLAPDMARAVLHHIVSGLLDGDG